MMSTEMAAVSALTNDGCAGTSIHAAKVKAAMASTVGTNTLEMRSARRWIGACDPWASLIKATMRASTLDAPIAVASTSNAPEVLMVAPITRSPARFSTGIDSPVSIDSSTAPLPDRTMPSTGKRSPGRTTTTLPGASEAIGTSSSTAPRRTRAVDGCNLARLRSARLVWLLARASMALPVSTSAMIRMTAS
jgi:hypothetical protein